MDRTPSTLRPALARRLAARAIPLFAALALGGCIGNNLPTLRTEQIDVAGVGPQGLILHVRLSTTNERYSGTIHLDALRVNATVGGFDAGVVDVPQSWDLPPHQPVMMETDIVIPLANLPALVMQAASGPVPYHLDGNAHVANIGWTVDFHYDGFISQQQLLGAAMPAMGGLPFGLSP